MASRAGSARSLFYQVVGASFILGGAVGVYIGLYGVEEFLAVEIMWSPPLVIATSVVYVVSLLGASYLLNRAIDDNEKMIANKAGAFANAAFVTLYPVWFLLWKGGLTPEPMHLCIFIGFVVSMTVSSLFYRFR